MSSRELTRLSGIVLLLGGAIYALGNLLHPLDHSPASQASQAWVPAHAGLLVAMMLMLLGLPVLSTRLSSRASTLGLAGAALWALGLIALLPGMWVDVFVVPIVGPKVTASILDGPAGAFMGLAGLAFLIGPLLFSLASLRTPGFPRPAGALLISSSLLLLPTMLLPAYPGEAIIGSTVITALGVAWYGYALARGPVVTTPRPARHSEDSPTDLRPAPAA